MNQFASSLAWWQMLVKSTIWHQSLWTWPSFKVTGMGESSTFCVLSVLIISRSHEPGWIKFGWSFEACLSDEFYAYFLWSYHYSRVRTLLVWFVKKRGKKKERRKEKKWLAFRNLPTFFFKLGMFIETSEPYILIWIWMTLTFVQGHSWARNWKLLHSFSRKFLIRFWGNAVLYDNLSVCWRSC